VDFEDNEEMEVSHLLAGTIGLHELFKTMMAGGFTEVQALRLVALMIMEGGALDGGNE
jgi:hypothetical protein